MSAADIIAELPKLDHTQRREIARRLFELENEAQLLADTDHRTNENFLLLDALESDIRRGFSDATSCPPVERQPFVAKAILARWLHVGERGASDDLMWKTGNQTGTNQAGDGFS